MNDLVFAKRCRNLGYQLNAPHRVVGAAIFLLIPLKIEYFKVFANHLNICSLDKDIIYLFCLQRNISYQ